MGNRALAVDAGVGPEVDEDHVTTQAGQGERCIPLGVAPPGDPRELRGHPTVRQIRSEAVGRGDLAVGEVPGVRCTLQGAQRCGRLVVALDRVLERLGVAGEVSLEGRCQIGGNRHRHQEEGDAGDLAELRAAVGQPLLPLDDAISGQRDDEQGDGNPDAEGEAQRHALDAGLVASTEDGNGGEDGSGAGHEDEAKAEPEGESRTRARRSSTSESSEGSLEECFELGDEEGCPEEHQGGNPEVVQHGIREVQRAQDLGSERSNEAKTQDESSHNGNGPTTAGTRGRLHLGTRWCPTSQYDGQDGEDAR